MTIQQFNKRLERANQNLLPSLLDIGKRVLLNQKAAVQERVQNTGMDADGKPFAPYTPAYQQFKQDVGRYRGHVDFTLGNFSIGKRLKANAKRQRSRNKIAKAFGQGGRTALTSDEIKQIKKTRNSNNIPKGDTLWRSINLKHEEQSTAGIRVSVAPLDAFNEKKADGLSVKRGNFLRLNQQEQTNALKDIETEVEEYLVKTIGT